MPEPAAMAADVLAGRQAPATFVRRAQREIGARNGALNALVDFDPKAADVQIAALELRLEAGERPPLAGVPVTVKDHIEVEGWRCTEGSLLYRHRVAASDDPVVTRLRAAGAIIVGRTNMSEFGCKGVTTNRVYGPTRHPADLKLTPGGSSGGAAAAVAAGLAPLALASDGGGSVRRPAAHAGVVGFKPSTGAIANPRGLSPTSVFGVIARSVTGATALFEALAGRDPLDPFSVDLPIAEPAPPNALRFAWSPKLGLDVPVDPEVEATMASAVERLRLGGFRIERADPQWPEEASEEALMPIQHAGLAAAHGVRWTSEPDLFDPDIAAQIASGMRLSAVDLCRALDMSLAVAAALTAFFARGFHLLLSPTTPCTAWPLEKLGPDRIGGIPVGPRAHAVFTPFFNHGFCPAISVPAGAVGGLPIGLQIAGPRLSDRLVLQVALAVEACLRS